MPNRKEKKYHKGVKEMSIKEKKKNIKTNIDRKREKELNSRSHLGVDWSRGIILTEGAQNYIALVIVEKV